MSSCSCCREVSFENPEETTSSIQPGSFVRSGSCNGENPSRGDLADIVCPETIGGVDGILWPPEVDPCIFYQLVITHCHIFIMLLH